MRILRVLLLALLALPAQVLGQGLFFPNLGFESGQEDWNNWGSPDNRGEAVVDTAMPCADLQSLHMFDSATRTRRITRNFFVPIGLPLTVSFYTRTKNLGTNQARAIIGDKTLILPPGTSFCTIRVVEIVTQSNVLPMELLLGPVTNGQPSNDAEVSWDAFFFAPGHAVTTTTIAVTTTTTTIATTTTTPTIVTTSTVPPTTTTSTSTTTTTTLPSGDCTGPVTTISGVRSKTYRPTIARDGCIDATAATFLSSSSNRYPVQVFGGPGGVWRGGLIQGLFSRSLTWGQMHDINPTAFRIETPDFLLEGLRVDVAGDGIKVRAPNFTIRGAHLTWTRDDCIEATTKEPGVIVESLLEECYVGISTRGDRTPPSGSTIEVRDTLIGLVPMPGPHSSQKRASGHGNILKTDDDSPAFLFENVVVFATQQTRSEGGLGLPDDVEIDRCRNNLMLYAGTEPIDEAHFGRDPVTNQPCFTFLRGQAARDRWAQEVAQWKAAHP